MKKLRWCIACLALAGCSNPAKERYEASVDCAANEYPRHNYVDQSTNPGEMLKEDRQIWTMLNLRAQRDGLALHIPAERVHQEIVARGKILQQQTKAGKFGETVEAATVLYKKAHQCLRQVGGPAAEKLLNPT